MQDSVPGCVSAECTMQCVHGLTLYKIEGVNDNLYKVGSVYWDLCKIDRVY